MREGAARILLIVAPSIIECYRTVQYFGIDLGEYAGQLRYISRALFADRLETRDALRHSRP
ncbi:hypothetical protein ACVI55_000504 [Sinorhizobium medicae]